MGHHTVRSALAEATQRLRSAGIETARLDAEVLMMYVLGEDRAALYRSLPDPLPVDAAGRFFALVERRAAGEPVAYLTGTREFYGLPFLVTPATLIPRPETEFLVSWARDRIQQASERSVAVDVGTGCGAIAIALARALGEDWRVLLVASDISREALRVARANRDRLAPGRVHLVCGDLLAWCRGPVDLVTANLPYLRPDQAHAGIAYEPALALFAGSDSFALYRTLLEQARTRLSPRGAIVCEIDPSQRQRALETAQAFFPEAKIRVLPDLAGHDRYLTIELRE